MRLLKQAPCHRQYHGEFKSETSAQQRPGVVSMLLITHSRRDNLSKSTRPCEKDSKQHQIGLKFLVLANVIIIVISLFLSTSLQNNPIVGYAVGTIGVVMIAMANWGTFEHEDESKMRVERHFYQQRYSF